MNDLYKADSGTWSLGVLIGLPVALFLLALTIGTGLWLWSKRDDDIDGNLAKNAARYGCPGVALVILSATAWAMYPYGAEYHQWRDVTGTVNTIDSRLIGDNKSTSTKFVVVIDGQQFACDDTRCAAVREGDFIELSCKRAWQYTGTDGYDCRFVSTKAAGR